MKINLTLLDYEVGNIVSGLRLMPQNKQNTELQNYLTNEEIKQNPHKIEP